MAKTRKGISYSKKLERPYTRKSKYRKKSFVRATPRNKVIRFMGGNKIKQFPYRLDLISKSDENLIFDNGKLLSNLIDYVNLGHNNILFHIS